MADRAACNVNSSEPSPSLVRLSALLATASQRVQMDQRLELIENDVSTFTPPDSLQAVFSRWVEFVGW